MAEYSDVTQESVLRAICEYDERGQDEFLKKHGYRPAWEYVIETTDGRQYDSKAVLGVACGYEHPDSGVPPYDEFPGGMQTVVPHLLTLGFPIRELTTGKLYTPESDGANTETGAAKVSTRSADPSPLVLVQNEVTAAGGYDFWKDATGERYHFPNTYRNRVQEGGLFVYYRGVRRANGSTGTPEYFGWGHIGDVWRDPDIPESEPKNQWRWFCHIDEYHPFANPVPAKIDGEYLEDIEHQNLWQVGVREISRATFLQILRLADYDPTAEDPGCGAGESYPAASEAAGEEQTGLLVASTRGNGGSGGSSGGGSSGGANRRRSRFSKVIGDWAEEFVVEYLKEQLPDEQAETVSWPAKERQTPGWDVQYIDAGGNTIGVEVKGTTGAAFPSFELTANEWSAAREKGASYAVMLVTKCQTLSPNVQRIDDPHGRWEAGKLNVEPQVWRVAATPTEETRGAPSV